LGLLVIWYFPKNFSTHGLLPWRLKPTDFGRFGSAIPGLVPSLDDGTTKEAIDNFCNFHAEFGVDGAF
jgi:hypothetical protein